ncbi:L,D-transpeptidase [Tsukamurella sp. 8F]|uniref:L,D-transpeptidase n=1 Tax=unclassified Tsukamurella TaxID=2633480 RepID=UPI0023BA2E5E|nr:MULTISPECIES: L,D-transpeptidase [unclassified Tsukamurella]MDF0530688.1 L,D-transpeptidase [Tsukamurella sp. 8J]MDF0587889.1 L,D-transpeptidase [Tsukamurella sp. 8F]
MTAMIAGRRGTARMGAAVTATALAFSLATGVAAAKPAAAAQDTTPPVATKTGWVALADDASHQMTVWHNGEVVRKMPISMGSAKHPTPNGTYYTMEKYSHMVMSSATYGVPVNSAEGYETPVDWATRMSWSGIFVHAAPWSVAQQGYSNVSHGCINVSTSNGKFIYDNFPSGTPIVVRGTSGGTYVPGS